MTINSLYPEKEIIEILYHNDDSINDLINCFNELLLIPELPKQLLILSDTNNCNFKISYEDTEIITRMMNILSLKCNFIKHAVITDNPLHTAMMTLTGFKIKNLNNYYLKLFCTKDAANKFLLVC